jgi:hypothetical protein
LISHFPLDFVKRGANSFGKICQIFILLFLMSSSLIKLNYKNLNSLTQQIFLSTYCILNFPGFWGFSSIFMRLRDFISIEQETDNKQISNMSGNDLCYKGKYSHKRQRNYDEKCCCTRVAKERPLILRDSGRDQYTPQNKCLLTISICSCRLQYTE